MKTHKLVLLTSLLVYSTVVSAQDYAFKVLASKGQNEIKAGTAWQPLKTGATLKSGDEVRLSENSYVGLVHSTGKPVEVKQSGVHKVAELEERVPAGSSVLAKYTDFILSSNASGGNNRLSATGAVHRDLNMAGPAGIHLYLPESDHTGVFNKSAVIKWTSNKVEGPYIVTVKNMFEDVLTKQEVDGTTYKLNLDDKKYAEETAFLIEVSSKTNEKVVSERHMIKKLSPAEIEKVASALQEVKGQLVEENAMSKALLAGFYENQRLLIDALASYEEAVELEPEAFRESYEAFLTRNNLK